MDGLSDRETRWLREEERERGLGFFFCKSNFHRFLGSNVAKVGLSKIEKKLF